jgi:2-methylcitrate dehydratase PrpD
MTAANTLAEFAGTLRYEDIPAPVIARAKACIADTIAACTFGAQLPWSRMVIRLAQENSAAGDACILGSTHRVRASFAALANGATAHAFELDSMCQPSVGAHPGAGLAVPGLAVAQTQRNSSRDLITAFVAGCEVMYRIGDAAHHSSEKIGFHAPGLLGVYGGAITAGLLMKLDNQQLAHALGIAGSMTAGILEFSKSGGMVKRLHLGRAAEAAIHAATLAADGFTGPAQVIEGKFGFLNVYCRGADPAKLTAGFGRTWHTLTTTLKCYACHSTAHVPVTAALALKAQGIKGDDIEAITVAGSEKMTSHHNITEPQELSTAQYSAPFSVALAFYRDPRDPAVFSDATLNDPAIRALTRKVKLEVRTPQPGDTTLASSVTVRLKNGREIAEDCQFYPGMPQQPLTVEELRTKFNALTGTLPSALAATLFEQCMTLETVADIGAIELA